jgi:hypothetical protein
VRGAEHAFALKQPSRAPLLVPAPCPCALRVMNDLMASQPESAEKPDVLRTLISSDARHASTLHLAHVPLPTHTLSSSSHPHVTATSAPPVGVQLYQRDYS